METWDEVNKALGEMARLRVRIDDAEVVMNDAFNKAKEKADRIITPLQTKYEDLEAQMEAFALAHKAEFAKRRTRRLFFGAVSYRVSTKIVISVGKGICLATLAALGLTDYIRVKQEPDLEAMNAMDDVTLAKVGAKRVPDDRCTVKPDIEKIREEVAA